ncbi:hypothetical protein SDC9_164851 [bioreactor metagenome]|uniref:Uncharacterized protein n=1 Tax=bioreactor metagenome TaxID=1076179 RepID=A0A645FSS1_9ZZZZ
MVMTSRNMISWSMLVVSDKTFSTSIIITSRLSANSVTAVTRPPVWAVSISGGTRILLQSRRRMVSTPSTKKPWVCPLYSVTIMISRGVPGVMPEYFARSITGTSAPRKLTIPSTEDGISGAAVIAGVRITSRTLKTLMP